MINGQFILVLTNEFFEFDPATGSWTDRTQNVSNSFPSPRKSLGFTAACGKLYVFGGFGCGPASALVPGFKQILKIICGSVPFTLEPVA